MNRLCEITLKGFKTIEELEDFPLGPLTVLIGPNGAGKSNFLSFFRMMSWALADADSLARFVGQKGGASKLLHDGPDRTREIEAELTIRTDAGVNQYLLRLFFAADDALILADERYRFSHKDHDSTAPWRNMGAGHSAPRLLDEATRDKTAEVILSLLRRIKLYQFHNSSFTARIRSKWGVHDNKWLREDASNVAPVLLRLKQENRGYYQRIVDTIRLLLPFFSDFEFEPDNGHLILAWRDRDSDRLFTASQASDGMLRIIALVVLLLQLEKDLPIALILDEPELGLHPYAVNVIAGLMRAVSTRTQIILATQSTAFVDCFEPSDVVVVEREGRSTRFRRLDTEGLGAWLEEYSLSELWDMNIIGGRP